MYSCFSTDAAPLYKLLRNDVSWKWGSVEAKAFNKLKELLSSDSLLVHFDPTLHLGIAWDASSVGIGAILFHRYPNADEKPIANVSKWLSASQRKYNQIQKELLSIIKKFYQYIYGKKFIILTDHKPLVTLFAPDKPVSGLAANRLAQWALFLDNFSTLWNFERPIIIKTLMPLVVYPPAKIQSLTKKKRKMIRMWFVLSKLLSLQIKSIDSSLVKKESSKDPVLAKVMRFTRESWPSNLPSNDPAQQFRRISDSLSNCHGCLLYGIRLVIPSTFRKQVLQLLHTELFIWACRE